MLIILLNCHWISLNQNLKIYGGYFSSNIFRSNALLVS